MLTQKERLFKMEQAFDMVQNAQEYAPNVESDDDELDNYLGCLDEANGLINILLNDANEMSNDR